MPQACRSTFFLHGSDSELRHFVLCSELGQHVRAEAEGRFLPPPPSAHLGDFPTPRLVSVSPVQTRRRQRAFTTVLEEVKLWFIAPSMFLFSYGLLQGHIEKQESPACSLQCGSIKQCRRQALVANVQLHSCLPNCSLL